MDIKSIKRKKKSRSKSRSKGRKKNKSRNKKKKLMFQSDLWKKKKALIKKYNKSKKHEELFMNQNSDWLDHQLNKFTPQDFHKRESIDYQIKEPLQNKTAKLDSKLQNSMNHHQRSSVDVNAHMKSFFPTTFYPVINAEDTEESNDLMPSAKITSPLRMAGHQIVSRNSVVNKLKPLTKKQMGRVKRLTSNEAHNYKRLFKNNQVRPHSISSFNKGNQKYVSENMVSTMPPTEQRGSKEASLQSHINKLEDSLMKKLCIQKETSEEMFKVPSSE